MTVGVAVVPLVTIAAGAIFLRESERERERVLLLQLSSVEKRESLDLFLKE